MHVDDLDTVFTQPVDPAAKRARLAHDYFHDPELTDEAAAIPAGRERRDHDRILVASLTTGPAKRIRLAVYGGVVILDPPIVSSAEQRSVVVEECGTDGDAPFGKTCLGLLEGNVEHCLVVVGRHVIGSHTADLRRLPILEEYTRVRSVAGRWPRPTPALPGGGCGSSRAPRALPAGRRNATRRHYAPSSDRPRQRRCCRSRASDQPRSRAAPTNRKAL